MQISVLKKLLLPIKRLTNRKAQKSSAETLESREVSEMQGDERMLNAECGMQNAEQMQNAECGMQNYSTEEECAAHSVSEVTAEVTEANEPCEEPTEASSPKVNTKAHLSSSVPRATRVPSGALTKSQMAEIRSILGDVDDSEIHRLYKKVTQ